MPDITFTVPDKAISALQQLADDFNAQTAHSYTLTDWLTYHILGLAISAKLSADAEAIKKEQDADFPRRIEARRRELLADIAPAQLDA